MADKYSAWMEMDPRDAGEQAAQAVRPPTPAVVIDRSQTMTPDQYADANRKLAALQEAMMRKNAIEQEMYRQQALANEAAELAGYTKVPKDWQSKDQFPVKKMPWNGVK